MVELDTEETTRVYKIMKDLYDDTKNRDPKKGQYAVQQMIRVASIMGASKRDLINMEGIYWDFQKHMEE